MCLFEENEFLILFFNIIILFYLLINIFDVPDKGPAFKDGHLVSGLAKSSPCVVYRNRKIQIDVPLRRK
jgi:hypothetical protein